jgi:hypothetical protein
VVDHVLAETAARQIENLQPMVFDLLDRQAIAEIDIQLQREVVRPKSEAVDQEVLEETNHARI